LQLFDGDKKDVVSVVPYRDLQSNMLETLKDGRYVYVIGA